MRKSRKREPNASFAAPGCWRRKNNRHGATAVEFAVIAPVFFALVFGLVEFGRMTMVKQALSNAAGVGCRTACLATTRDANRVEDAVRDSLESFMSAAGDAGLCRINIEPSEFDEVERGDEITVNVEVNFSDVSWLSTGYLQDTTLTAQATMKRE